MWFIFYSPFPSSPGWRCPSRPSRPGWRWSGPSWSWGSWTPRPRPPRCRSWWRAVSSSWCRMTACMTALWQLTSWCRAACRGPHWGTERGTGSHSPETARYNKHISIYICFVDRIPLIRRISFQNTLKASIDLQYFLQNMMKIWQKNDKYPWRLSTYFGWKYFDLIEYKYIVYKYKYVYF